MNYKYDGDISHVHKRWLFENGWRLEVYIVHLKLAKMTLFDTEGAPRIYQEYPWHRTTQAEVDALAILAFGGWTEVAA